MVKKEEEEKKDPKLKKAAAQKKKEEEAEKVKLAGLQGDNKGEKGGKGKGDKGGKGKGEKGEKGKGRLPDCTFVDSPNGCRNGGICTSWHKRLTAQDGKCFNCGSAHHSSPECDRQRRKPKEETAPVIRKAQEVDAKTSAPGELRDKPDEKDAALQEAAGALTSIMKSLGKPTQQNDHVRGEI